MYEKKLFWRIWWGGDAFLHPGSSPGGMLSRGCNGAMKQRVS
jgi:hypothetical protein